MLLLLMVFSLPLINQQLLDLVEFGVERVIFGLQAVQLLAHLGLVLLGEELGDCPGQHPDEADAKEHQDDGGAPADPGLGDDVAVADGRSGRDGPPERSSVGDPFGDAEHCGGNHDYGDTDVEVVDQFVALEEGRQASGEADQAEEAEELQHLERPPDLRDSEERKHGVGGDDREQVEDVVFEKRLLVLGPDQAGKVVDGEDEPDPVIDQAIWVGIDVDLLSVISDEHDDRDDREDRNDDLIGDVG